MRIHILFILFFTTLLFSKNSFSQPATFKWWNPAESTFPVIEGRGWSAGLQAPYDRMPATAEKTVRQAVWDLSRHSAGLYIKFRTDASDIIIRYTTGNRNYAMPHMPATGVSGLDLYAIDHSGNWVWARAKYRFGDTIEYRFSNMEVDSVFKARSCEFRLFLPLYNSVSWMSVGIPEANSFVPFPLAEEKPIVVYGTSIAQGACASRPGMAWTSVVQRNLDRPLINLGFSGNGKLEQPVSELLAGIPAALYILDCLPNLSASDKLHADEVESKLISTVKYLRQKSPLTPVLLTEHSLGNHTGIIDTALNHECERLNAVLRRAFAKLQADGIKNIYILSSNEIGLGADATVDGVHPNDAGMETYAKAYIKKIRAILQEPEGIISTMIPVIQDRDGYDWRGRHAAIRQLNRDQHPQHIILANSIIHYWGGEPQARIATGKGSWQQYLEPVGLQNMGFGWDRIENVLWRVYHGALDSLTAKNIILMIGTNNLSLNTNAEIIAGLDFLLRAIRLRQPEARILLSGLFPRRNMEKRIVSLNNQIAVLAKSTGARYIDPGKVLLGKGAKIDEALFSDGLHPNAKGYTKLAPLIAGYLAPLK